ncbi:MAG: hypothetical protein IKN07_11955 [Lachnospiraceae bacterium]|nr:hypothetical protein [Lachnospiraceae bacterium]MBR3736588.1 hypothetical protein [Lachnospiraceae bacterium]
MNKTEQKIEHKYEKHFPKWHYAKLLGVDVTSMNDRSILTGERFSFGCAGVIEIRDQILIKIRDQILSRKIDIEELGQNIDVRLIMIPGAFHSTYKIMLRRHGRRYREIIDTADWSTPLIDELGACYSSLVFKQAIEDELDLTERMEEVCALLKLEFPDKAFTYQNEYPYAPYILKISGYFELEGFFMEKEVETAKALLQAYIDAFPKAKENYDLAKSQKIWYYEKYFSEK